MSWLHLGRVFGVVVGAVALVSLVRPIAEKPAHMLLAFACMVAGLLLSVFCTQSLAAADKREQDRVREQGEHLAQAHLEIGVRWFRWLLWVAMVAVVEVVLVGVCLELWRHGSLLWAAVAAAGVFLLAGMLWSYFSVAWHAVRRGHLLRMDERGLEIAGDCFIPWPQLRGSDLRVHEAKGNKRYILCLAVEPTPAIVVKGGAWPWQWGRSRLSSGGSVVSVPLFMLAVDPQFLDGAVRRFGRQYGAGYMGFWKQFLSPAQTAEMAQLEDRMHRFDQMTREILAQDAAKPPVAEEGRVLQESLNGLDARRLSQNERVSS